MQEKTPAIQIHRSLEITTGPNYHAAVSVDGLRRWHQVNSGTFYNDALAVHAETVLDQLRDRDDLLSYEYDEDGSRCYMGLRHHDPDVWIELHHRT